MVCMAQRKETTLIGKGWFRVESKSFEIKVKVAKGQVVGKILERGQGFSSWIRLGEKSLVILLKGVKDFFFSFFFDR